MAEAGEGGGSGEQRANNGNASHLGDGVTTCGLVLGAAHACQVWAGRLDATPASNRLAQTQCNQWRVEKSPRALRLRIASIKTCVNSPPNDGFPFSVRLNQGEMGTLK